MLHLPSASTLSGSEDLFSLRCRLSNVSTFLSLFFQGTSLIFLLTFLLLHAEMWISKALSHCLVSLTNVKLTTLSFFLFLPQASKSTTRAVPPLFTENASKQSLLFYCLSVVSCREAVEQNYPLPPLPIGIRSIFLQSFLYVCLFCFAKSNLLAFSSSISLLPLPTFSNTEISLSSPVLLRGCCSRVSSFVSTYPSV